MAVTKKKTKETNAKELEKNVYIKKLSFDIRSMVYGFQKYYEVFKVVMFGGMSSKVATFYGKLSVVVLLGGVSSKVATFDSKFPVVTYLRAVSSKVAMFSGLSSLQGVSKSLQLVKVC